MLRGWRPMGWGFWKRREPRRVEFRASGWVGPLGAFQARHHPRSGVATVSPRYCYGIATVLLRCISHVDAINMGATPGIYRSNTVAIPWRHRSDTGPGGGVEPGRHPGGRPILTRLELHPAGLLPLPEPSAHGAPAPEHESPRSQRPRMSTSFAPKGLHELALCLMACPVSRLA